jgi:DNA-binding GntR family transcriptional regulator
MREEVYNNLLDWIMEGVLLPGEKIVDKELAEHMGVSRTPVREALRRLEDKDLVESSANRWTRISEIPPKEPEMIYPIIWTLEKLALSSAINTLTQNDFIKMKRINNRLEAALQKGDPVAASKADSDFHGVFIERSKNVHLIKIIQDLKVRFRRLEVNFFKGISYKKSSVREHETLISALADRDIVLAKKTVHLNWAKSLERLKKESIKL